MANSAVYTGPHDSNTLLGAEPRMNYPGKTEGNWLWRFQEGEYRRHPGRLADMATRYGRSR
ncbi:hypothetical protein GMSM_11840 [Geomonas sp. Red276]